MMIEERRGEYDDVKWPNCVPRASVIEGSFSNGFKREWRCTIPLSLVQMVSLKMYWRIFNMEFSLGCALPLLVHAQSVISSPWLSKQEIRKSRKKIIRKNGRKHLVNRQKKDHLSEGCSVILQQTGVQEEGLQELERKEKEQ